MSSSVESTPFMGSLVEGLFRYLPTSSEGAKAVLDSAALVQVFYATVKTLPYYHAEQFGINDFSHMLSSRVSYCEAAFISFVSTIHNLFFAVLYTGLVVVTLGFSKSLTSDCTRHWTQMFYGVFGVAIGSIGVVVPFAGIYATAFVLYHLWLSIQENYRHDLNLQETKLVREIQNIMTSHRDFIYGCFRNSSDAKRYQTEFGPSLAYIEAKLGSAKTMDDIIALALEVKLRFPKMVTN